MKAVEFKTGRVVDIENTGRMADIHGRYMFVYEDADGNMYVSPKEGRCNRIPSDPANLYLDPPDSWWRLLADLDRAASGCSMCDYAGKNIGECSECKFNKVPCTIGVFADIADRIRALRSEGE